MSEARYGRRCACRAPDGKQYGAKCPKLKNPRHGTWQVFVNVPATTTTERQRIRKGGFGSKAEAEAWAKPYVRAKLDGQRLIPTRETLGSYLPKYLERRSSSWHKPLSAATIAKEQTYAKPILTHAVASIPLSELRRRNLQDFIDDAAKSHGTSALEEIKKVLTGCLTAADDDELTNGSPATRLRLPSIERAEKVLLSSEQVATLLPLLGENSPQLRYIAEIALWTGMRVGEVVGVRWDDIDSDVLTMSQTVESVRGQLSFGKGKTKAARRQIVLGPLALNVLTRQRALQNRQRLRAGSAWSDLGLVFATELGTPVDPKYPTKRLKVVERGAGLPLMTMHGFRHLHVTHLDLVGTPQQITKQRVGHSSTSDLTEAVYTHRSVDAQRTWAAAAERIVGDMLSTQPADLSSHADVVELHGVPVKAAI